MQKQRRRLFLRKPCILETDLVAPNLETIVKITDISLGGFRVEWDDHVPEGLPLETRVRLALPMEGPQEMIISGSQVAWKTENACGLRLIYLNSSNFQFQQFIENTTFSEI